MTSLIHNTVVINEKKKQQQTNVVKAHQIKKLPVQHTWPPVSILTYRNESIHRMVY